MPPKNIRATKDVMQIWEPVYEYTGKKKALTRSVHRMLVPGGWLIWSNTVDIEIGLSESLCFLPDADHKWKLELEQPQRDMDQSSNRLSSSAGEFVYGIRD